MPERLVGHEEAWSRLQGLQGQRHSPPPVLLHGIKGCGKSLMVLRMAQSWVCATHSGCGQCRACLQVAAGTHPDSLLIEREDDKAAIAVEQIRSIASWEPLGSSSASGKVIRILDIEFMQEPAQNALLKILEEPSQGVLFLLTSSHQGGILPTLLSRCHLVRLRPLSLEELSTIARQEGWPIKDPAAFILSAGSAGVLRYLAGVDVGAFVRHVLDHLAVSSPQDSADIVAGLREFQAKHPADSELSTHVGFTQWMIDNLILMMGEGLRLRAGLPLCHLTAFREDVEALARRMTYVHLESATISLLRARSDLGLHLDPWAVLEESIRRILVERFVQVP